MPVLRRRSPPSQPMQGSQPDLPQLWKARPPRLGMSPEEQTSCPPASQPRPFVLTSGASNSRPPGCHPDQDRWRRGRRYPLASSGADIDAMSAKDLATVDPNLLKNLAPDHHAIHAANGYQLQSLGTIPATLHLQGRSCDTRLHVYSQLNVSMLSKSTCISLGLLEEGWPTLDSKRQHSALRPIHHLALPRHHPPLSQSLTPR